MHLLNQRKEKPFREQEKKLYESKKKAPINVFGGILWQNEMN
jgi:hypothetical protein